MNRKLRFHILPAFLALALALLLAACAPQSMPAEPTPAMPANTPAPMPTVAPADLPDTSGPGTIVDIAVADERFSTLVTALQAAGLVETLQGDGPFTVFAPTDEAFAALPEGTIDALLQDIPQLTDILLYHVVSGKVMAADVVTLDGKQVETALPGAMIGISVQDGSVFLNEDVQVTITDIEASNGVIHVIDAVLLPPSGDSSLEGEMGDIVEIASTDERFTTLVSALVTADLVEALQGEGPFTVFAPTNDAFAALPEGTLESLTTEELTNILLYHVVEGKFTAEQVIGLDGQEVETLLGEPVTITLEDGNVVVNEAMVIITDIETANGVIHVIDMVLLPPQ
jgi:transforming growth factor-beta-induced protein